MLEMRYQEILSEQQALKNRRNGESAGAADTALTADTKTGIIIPYYFSSEDSDSSKQGRAK